MNGRNFNYIVTVHNSARHIKYVYDALLNVKTSTSKVYVVIDGCTDESKQIAKDYSFNILETNDVRETLAINHALKNCPQDGYNIILQDDVIIRDKNIEEKIKTIYQQFPDLGVLGFRHGCNFEKDILYNNKPVSEVNLIMNKWQPHFANIEQMNDGYITFRHVVYKSPICVSSEVVNKLGGYDERFAPIAHDDTEYCIRAMKAGYKNAVVSIDIDQPISWGGTRRFSSKYIDLHREHMNLIRKIYPAELLEYSSKEANLTQIKLW